jgi:FkbM family methyltransferase
MEQLRNKKGHVLEVNMSNLLICVSLSGRPMHNGGSVPTLSVLLILGVVLFLSHRSSNGGGESGRSGGDDCSSFVPSFRLSNNARFSAVHLRPSGVVQFIHDPDQDGFISKSLWNTGYWQADDVKRIVAHLSARGPSSLLLDVGANIGSFSLRAIDAGHRAIMIEPFSYNSELLELSISIAWNSLQKQQCYLHKISVSEESHVGTQLCLTSNDRINGGNGYAIRSGEEGACKERVNVTTIDRLVDSRTDITVMKMDIEGYEVYALRGAHKLLSTTPPCVIHIEVNVPQLRKNGTPPELLYATLKSHGYVESERFGVGELYDTEFRHPRCSSMRIGFTTTKN